MGKHFHPWHRFPDVIWRPTVYSLAPFVAAGVASALVWVAWRYRDRPVGKPFLAVVIGIFGWSLAHGLQLGFTTRETQLFWIAVTQTFAVTIPTSWFVLALVYSGREGLLNRRRLAILASEPAAMILLLWTMPLHDLVFRYRGSTTVDGVPVATIEMGPAMLVHVVYGYLLILGGVVLLVGVAVRASSVYRRQAALLVVGSLVALGANVVVVLGVNPLAPVDLTTIAFTATGAVFGLALFGFDLLNLTPVAREQLIDEFGSGLVVIDDQDQVTHFNEIAEQTLENLERVGQRSAAVFGVDDLRTVDGKVLTCDVDGDRRAYDLRVSSIEDYRNREVGSLVALRDVTDRRQYEQRLEVTNRLLRHNLRNDMNKIIGWSDVLEEELAVGPEAHRDECFDESARGASEVVEADTIAEATALTGEIREIAREVADLGRKANQIEATLEAGRADSTVVPLDDVLVGVSHDIEQTWPVGSVQLSVPNGTDVMAPSLDLLETALYNLVENGLEHNDADDPRVELTARIVGDEVEIRIADDGPGIPEMERRVLEEGHETSLQHGSGLGLWLAKWVLNSTDGSLQFEPNQPRGTVVVVRLPALETGDVPPDDSD